MPQEPQLEQAPLPPEEREQAPPPPDAGAQEPTPAKPPEGEVPPPPAPSETEELPEAQPPEVLVVPGLGTIRIQRQRSREVPEELANANPELVEAVMKHLYDGSQKELYKTGVVLRDFEKLKEKLSDEELNEKISDAFAKAEEEYNAKHSDIARSTRKQLIEMVKKYEKRLQEAENPEREMIVIQSELYERNKEAAKLDAMLTSRLKIEYTLYPVTRGHSDIIANETADRAVVETMRLRALGYEKEGNQYHMELLEHKAVRTAEDESMLHDLKHHKPRLKKGADKDTRVDNSAPAPVDPADLGVMTAQLAAEVRRAVPPGVAPLISV